MADFSTMLAAARQLTASGKPDAALDLMEDAGPGDSLPAAEAVPLALERLFAYTAWAKHSSAASRLRLFFYGQRAFYQIVRHAPQHADAFHLQAQLWAFVGNPDMSARLLRTLHHVAPHEVHAAAIARFSEMAVPAPLEWRYPEWPVSYRPRILLITHENADYGLDCLYDGLARLLGADHVVEYPWKPTLHGEQRDLAANYPCFFNYSSQPRSLEALTGELRDGRFDLIAFADPLQLTPQEDVRKLMEAGRNVPWVIFDSWDDGIDPHQDACAHVGRDDCLAIFKREMVIGGAYHPHTWPMPFAYSRQYMPAITDTARTRPLFWAGQEAFGLRKLYLDFLTARFGLDLRKRYAPEDYAEALLDSRVGLSCFGFGYDTVRYWEVPAHGAVLLAERPPIELPNNFVDGDSAFFFEDLPDLARQLERISGAPELSERVAMAGLAHVRRHHTTEARARQFLGVIASVL